MLHAGRERPMDRSLVVEKEAGLTLCTKEDGIPRDTTSSREKCSELPMALQDKVRTHAGKR